MTGDHPNHSLSKLESHRTCSSTTVREGAEVSIRLEIVPTWIPWCPDIFCTSYTWVNYHRRQGLDWRMGLKRRFIPPHTLYSSIPLEDYRPGHHRNGKRFFDKKKNNFELHKCRVLTSHHWLESVVGKRTAPVQDISLLMHVLRKGWKLPLAKTLIYDWGLRPRIATIATRCQRCVFGSPRWQN
jgi:hypothetical protein